MDTILGRRSSTSNFKYANINSPAHIWIPKGNYRKNAKKTPIKIVDMSELDAVVFEKTSDNGLQQYRHRYCDNVCNFHVLRRNVFVYVLSYLN